jgi:diguanylate cyclase (GGDEF)-like protein
MSTATASQREATNDKMRSKAYSRLPQEFQSTKSRQQGFPFNVLGGLAKRTFDFTMALIGLLFLAPVFAFIAVLIRRDSPGPVFFWGARMGKNGRPFQMLKFRTMYERLASYQGPRVTAKGDDRITPLGHWLRDTKINELPQLWNVLRGEMSLVGPRPEDPDIAKTWPAEAFDEILSVNPGVTSPASILYHDEETLLSTKNVMGDYFKSILPDKIRLDRVYVRYRSFFSDIDIIFWTLAILIPQMAKTRIPEGYLFAGPFSRLVNRHISWFVYDSLTAFLAVTISALIWRTQGPLDWGIEKLGVYSVLLALLFGGVNYLMGSNRVVWARAKAEDGMGLVFAGVVVTGLILLANTVESVYRWLDIPPLPSIMLIIIGLLAQVGFIATRYRLRVVTVIAGRWLSWRQNSLVVGERVLIIGSGEGAQIASWLLRRQMFRTAFTIIGLVDDSDPRTHGMRVDGCWMLGGVNDLPALIKKHDAGVVLSTMPQRTPEMKYVFNLCHETGARLIFLNDLMWLVDRQVTRPAGEIDTSISLEEHLELKAMRDVVTELPTRSIFQDRLKHSLAYAKRYNTPRVVMFVELGELNDMTDPLGRKNLLKETSQRLRECKRESDTLARFRDHDFALLLENLGVNDDVEMITGRIMNKLSQPFYLHNEIVAVKPIIHFCQCDGKKCGALNAPDKIDMLRCYECAAQTDLKKQADIILAMDD